jgi:hypothetical protein
MALNDWAPRGVIPVAVLALVTGCTRPSSEGAGPAFQPPSLEGPAPWTGPDFTDSDADGDFTFAVLSDLTGGERDGVFDVAVAQLALLRPELIMNVGDLIEGESEDVAGLAQEWDVFDVRAARAPAPMFRVGGNHDLTSPAMRDAWAQRFGPLYYHFVYKDVLFLVLDTEDYTAQRRSEIHRARTEALEALYGGQPEVAVEMEYYQMPERVTGEIGPAQSAYMRGAITQNPDVRWTMLFMHKPVWRRDDEPEFDAIETALGDRPYTVFNGHLHSFSHAVKNGRDHIMLGTTGGAQNARDEAAFDHVTVITMTGQGPQIAHLRMDGILDKTGHIPQGGDTLCFQASRCGGGWEG